MKPLIGIQLVEVQPGQSRSGQAGSACCAASGDRWGEAYTARKRAARVQLRNRFCVSVPTPLAWRKAALGRALCEVVPNRRSPQPGARFHRDSPGTWESSLSPRESRGEVRPVGNGPGPRPADARPAGAKRASDARGTGRQGRPEATGTGREQSYDPILPMKVENRRARETGGHGIHWREGGNMSTYRFRGPCRYTEIGKACQQHSIE